MLNLNDYPKFKSDIQGSVTHVWAVVVINSDPPIYLSQHKEVIDGNEYIENNLKVPSIKESIDLESRKIKINNITVSISNIGNFSDVFATQRFINVPVTVYWKSASCESIGDCLPVYLAVIKRVDHDYDKVKFILEDKTQSTMHKDVPIASIDEEYAYNEKYVNKTIPMVYGTVKNAPAVLYKTQEADASSSTKYVYAIADRFDMAMGGTIDNGNSGHCLGGSDGSLNFKNYLSIFTGQYLNVLEESIEIPGVSNYPAKIQTYVSGGRIKLMQYFNVEQSVSSVADSVAQVVVNRYANSLTLIDYSTEGGSTLNNIHYNYLGADDGLDVGNPENALDYSEATYASIPYDNIDDFNNMETDNEEDVPTSTQFQHLQSCYNGAVDLSTVDFTSEEVTIGKGWVGTYSSSSGYHAGNRIPAPYLYDHLPFSTSHVPDYGQGYGDVDQSGQIRNYVNAVSNLMYYMGRSAPNSMPSNTSRYLGGDKFELIRLPWSKWVHGKFNEFLINQGEVGLRDWTLSEERNDSHIWQPTSAGRLSGTAWDYGQNFPQPEFRFEQTDGNYVTLKFTQDYDGEAIHGSSGGGYQFWELLADQYGYGYPYYRHVYDAYEQGDGTTASNRIIPRYKISAMAGDNFSEQDDAFQLAEGVAYSGNDSGSPQTLEYWRGNYNVWWNGGTAFTSVNDYGGDASEWGGRDTFETGGFSNSDQKRALNPWITYAERDEQESTFYGQYPGFWNEFTSSSNWWIRYAADEDLDFGGVTLSKGNLFPTTQQRTYRKIYNDYCKFQSPHWYPGGIAPESGDEEEGVGVSFLTAGSADYTARRIGVHFALEDASVEDVVPYSGVTTFMGRVQVRGDSDTSDSDDASLKISFVPSITTTDALPEEAIEADAGDLVDIPLSTLGYESSYLDDFKTVISSDGSNAIYEGVTIGDNPAISTDWQSPDDYNSASLRFYVEGGNTGDTAHFMTRISKLGVKHVLEIHSIFEKDFYFGTHGRSFSGATGEKCAPNIILDIIKRELEYTDISTSETGINSLGTAKAYLNNNWNLAFSIKEKVNSKKLIEDIGKNSPTIPLFKSDGTLGFAVIRNTYEEEHVSEEGLIKAKDVIKSSFTRTKIEDVKTIVRVKYEKDYGYDIYKSKTEYTDAYDFYGNSDEGFTNGYSKEYYGLDKDNPGDSVLEVESDYIRNSVAAKSLRDFLLAYNCNQHNIIKARLPLKYVNLEIADMVYFDELLEGKKCFGEDYTINNYKRNGQYIYKYFMITSVKKSISAVDIECIQMHNLSASGGVISQASGDINRNGGEPDQEDVDMLRNYVLDDYPYLTEGQRINGDYTLDGRITMSDVTLLDLEVNPPEADPSTGETEEEIEEAETEVFVETTLIFYETHYFTDFWYNVGSNYFLIPTQAYLDGTAGEHNLQFESGSNVYFFDFYNNSEITQNFVNQIEAGWYMKINDEYVHITAVGETDSGFPTIYTRIDVERGALNTTPVVHPIDSPIVFYTGEPLLETITEEGLMEVSTNLIDSNIGSGNSWGIQVANDPALGSEFDANNLLMIPNLDNMPSYIVYVWAEDLSIFYDHPDVWNCHTNVSSDYPSATGDNLDPFTGWYIKVDDEWMHIYDCDTMLNQDNLVSYTRLLVTRGEFGSDITAHDAGAVVEIWSSLPEGFTP